MCCASSITRRHDPNDCASRVPASAKHAHSVPRATSTGALSGGFNPPLDAAVAIAVEVEVAVAVAVKNAGFNSTAMSIILLL